MADSGISPKLAEQRLNTTMTNLHLPLRHPQQLRRPLYHSEACAIMQLGAVDENVCDTLHVSVGAVTGVGLLVCKNKTLIFTKTKHEAYRASASLFCLGTHSLKGTFQSSSSSNGGGRS